MSETPRKIKELQPVHDSREIIKFLSEATRSLIEAKIWTRDQTIVLDSHITMIHEVDRALFAWVPADFDPENFRALLSKNVVQEAYFSISLSKASLFFKAKFVACDVTGIRFEIPNVVYKVQRRMTTRYQIPTGYVLRMKYRDPAFETLYQERKVYDISAGGLSFLISDMEATDYSEGLRLRDMEFKIRTRSMKTDVEIRSKVPMKNLTKIGVHFLHLMPDETKLIDEYVFQESTKYYSRIY